MDAKNLVGTTLDGRYDVTRVIGAGGMGAVYEAQHVGTGRRVAIKVISTGDLTKDAQLVGRFQREAKAAGAIDTQHICGVLDTGTDPESGLPYMVMEYMVGEDVQQLLRRAAPLSPELALRIVAQTCLGLQKAHDTGVVHRDIKPANLFLNKSDGGNVIVKVLDFGIAKVKMETASEAGDAGLTRTGTMLGSPLYMSPEQARGMKTIDHRADIWSLGVVLYEMLSGRTPFHHIDALGELIIAICSEPPRPVQDFAAWVPPEVAAIVHKALKSSASERYQTASEMFEAVKALLPNGTAIDESMLISLSETQKNEVARRLTLPPPAEFRPSMPPPQLASQPPPALATEAGTTGGVAAPTERRPEIKPKSNATMLVVGAALGIALAAGLAYKFVGNEPQASAQGAANAVQTETSHVGAPPVETTTATAPPLPTVSPAPQDRTVRLVVMPDNADVVLDGNPVKANDGVIEIKGGLGSEHKVKLTVGKQTIEESVVIAEGGALPAKLELDVKTGKAIKQSVVGGAAAAVPGGTNVAKPVQGIEHKFE
ncbi:MAG TPA: serine/threonine-protein kinase [Polyangiaceae bacterium]|nr:serine/threonine-protein kinase [Polyangiaceae bacterium]